MEPISLLKIHRSYLILQDFIQLPLLLTNASGVDAETKTDYIIAQTPVLDLDLTVFLEGPFNGTTMKTDLTGLTDFPLNQPYNTAPWNYTGTESVVSLPALAVDWVLS